MLIADFELVFNHKVIFLLLTLKKINHWVATIMVVIYLKECHTAVFQYPCETDWITEYTLRH